MQNNNIFREARHLLRDKSEMEMNGEELITVKAALIPINILPEFNDKTIDEGLEELAKILDEAKQNGTVPRTDQVRAVPHVR